MWLVFTHMISYVIWFHTNKFIYETKNSHVIKFHIWPFTYELLNFICEITWFTYEILISHVKFEFHIWNSSFHIWNSCFTCESMCEFSVRVDFTYWNFTYELRISYVIWFHILEFHIWIEDFICDLFSHIEFHIWIDHFICDLISHIGISHMNWGFHMWFIFTYRISYMNWPFHMWFDFTYWNFTYELRISYVIYFHI